MGRILVSVETVKIKEFIFSTNKLKVIRGASYLLDYVNRVKIPKKLKDNNINDEDIVYINAGNAKFFVANEINAKDIITKIRNCYKKYAPGSKIVASYIEETLSKKIWTLFDELAENTAKQKSLGFGMNNIDLPIIEKCSLCDNNPAEVKCNDIKDNELKEQVKNLLGYAHNANNDVKEKGICNECLKKIEASNDVKPDEDKIGIYSTFKNIFKNKEQFNDFLQAVDIGDYTDSNSFVGFMYADGDGLGDFLKNIKESYETREDTDTAQKEYLGFYKEFSNKLDEITKKSLIDVMIDMHDRFPEKVDENGNKTVKRHYGEFLIVGGDDVCAIFPPNLVLEISERYQKVFQEKMENFWNEKFKDKTPRNNITTSCGVVIAKKKTPIHYLFDQSLILQKKAKKSRYERFKAKQSDYKKGFIDFQVIGSEGTVDISGFRESEGIAERNYIIDNIGDNCFGSIIKLIQDLKENNFPKNKIRKFYDISKMYKNSDFMRKMEILIFVDKLDTNNKVLAKKWLYKEKDFDSLPNLSNIYDVLELYDFIDAIEKNPEVINE